MSIREVDSLLDTDKLFVVDFTDSAEGPEVRMSVLDFVAHMATHLVRYQTFSFTETGGAATYTATASLPAGATVLDIIIDAIALWDNAGAVTMKVGDTDDDGFYTSINLKATDLLAGESLSFAQSGGKAGAYNVGTNTHWTNRYSATARDIKGIITAASTGGSAGRTRMTVVYIAPDSNHVTESTKV